MSTEPSIDEFEKLQLEIEERKKRLKSEMENLDRNLESVKKLKADREKAAQLYEAGLRELEETMLKSSAQFEPRDAKNDSKPTDSPSSPSPTPFSNKEKTSMKARVDLGMTKVKEEQQTINSPMRVSNKGCTSAGPSGTKDANDSGFSRKKQENEGQNSEARGERNVGEYSGRKGAIITNNSGVAEVNQGKSPRVRVQNAVYKHADSRNVGEFSGEKEHNSGVAKAKPEIQSKKTRAGGRGPAHLISRLCNLKIIKIIKDSLQRENLERFQQSCFGRLLEIKELEFQGQLYLHLLLSMDMAASNKEKLVFKFNNSSMEFGPREFFQITGLRIGTLEGTMKTPSSSSIHKKIFRGRPTIVTKDIEKAFLRHKVEGELKLKLALLWFLYGTLLAVNSSKRIDLQYLHLIDDLQNFNVFPWGRVAYEFFVSFMLSTRVLMDKKCSKNLKPSLFICGFSVALQVWAYEVIPSLAEFCAVRVRDSENLTSGILRWSTKRMIVRFGELKIFFKPGDEAHLEDVTSDTIHQPEKRKLLSEKDVYNLDTDDDDNDVRSMQTNKRKRRSKSTAAASDVPQATDSNDSSYSTTFMNNYVSNA